MKWNVFTWKYFYIGMVVMNILHWSFIPGIATCNWLWAAISEGYLYPQVIESSIWKKIIKHTHTCTHTHTAKNIYKPREKAPSSRQSQYLPLWPFKEITILEESQDLLVHFWHLPTPPTPCRFLSVCSISDPAVSFVQTASTHFWPPSSPTPGPSTHTLQWQISTLRIFSSSLRGSQQMSRSLSVPLLIFSLGIIVYLHREFLCG